MHYFHCTRDMMLESELYLYIHKGSLFTKKQIHKAIDLLKTDAVNLHIAVGLDRSVFEKLKTEGFKTIKEAVLSGSYGPAQNAFDAFEDHLAYWSLREHFTFQFAWCLEYMVKRDRTMYFVFKKRLMTDMLSFNDQVTLPTAEQMKEYYQLLCVNEPFYL